MGQTKDTVHNSCTCVWLISRPINRAYALFHNCRSGCPWRLCICSQASRIPLHIISDARTQMFLYIATALRVMFHLICITIFSVVVNFSVLQYLTTDIKGCTVEYAHTAVVGAPYSLWATLHTSFSSSLDVICIHVGN